MPLYLSFVTLAAAIKDNAAYIVINLRTDPIGTVRVCLISEHANYKLHSCVNFHIAFSDFLSKNIYTILTQVGERILHLYLDPLRSCKDTKNTKGLFREPSRLILFTRRRRRIHYIENPGLKSPVGKSCCLLHEHCPTINAFLNCNDVYVGIIIWTFSRFDNLKLRSSLFFNT